MRDFWTFIGSAAVGSPAVTGVFAMEEDDNPKPVDASNDDLELEGGRKEDLDDDGKLIVRAS